jgi:hypothetical protein
MNQTDPSFELKGLVSPEPYLPHHFMESWAWYLLAGGILLLALVVILVIRLVRKTIKTSPANIREMSYQQAVAALAVASHERIQEVATRVSAALRIYLARVSGDPALYETHEEFISRHQVLTKYPEELRNATSTTFSELAKLKYGKDASGDPERLIAGARQLLDQLHQVPAA